MNRWVLVAGIIVLLLGVGSYAYSVTTTDEAFGGLVEDTDVERPYRNFAFPLLAVGIGMVIVGVMVPERKG